MVVRRLMIVITAALAWCWGVWHEELEGAGLMFDHDHHHSAGHHGEDPAHEHPMPADSDDHRPVVARDQFQDGRPAILAQLLFALVVVFGCLRFILPTGFDGIRAVPRWRTPDLLSVWLFLRRCAPDAAAPPALT
jgi:hypothetical protein